VSRVKPAQVRFYVDADILGLGRVLAGLRPDVTFPGDPGAVLFKKQRPPRVVTTPATPDTEWIRRVTAEGLLIIIRDRQIQHHLAELQAVRDHGARMVTCPAKKRVARSTNWRS
jgi:PIN like domain